MKKIYLLIIICMFSGLLLSCDDSGSKKSSDDKGKLSGTWTVTFSGGNINAGTFTIEKVKQMQVLGETLDVYLGSGTIDSVEYNVSGSHNINLSEDNFYISFYIDDQNDCIDLIGTQLNNNITGEFEGSGKYGSGGTYDVGTGTFSAGM